MLKQQVHKPNHWMKLRNKKRAWTTFPSSRFSFHPLRESQHEKCSHPAAQTELYLDIQCLRCCNCDLLCCVWLKVNSTLSPRPQRRASRCSRCGPRPGRLFLRWLTPIHPLLSPADVRNPPPIDYSPATQPCQTVWQPCVCCVQVLKKTLL